MNDRFKEAMNIATPVSEPDLRDSIIRPQTQQIQETTTAAESPISVKEERKNSHSRQEAERKTESLKPLV